MARSVKVTLIDTQYVKTDATSFKSVVQSLTGKDSSVEWINQRANTFTGSNNNNNTTTTTTTTKRKKSTRVTDTVVGSINSEGKEDLFGGSVLSRGFSFKDFDRMLMEMPPVEDLQYWLSNDLYN